MNHINLPLIEQVSEELIEALGDEFDPEAFWDTLDGETDALDIMDRLIARSQDDAALVEAIKAEVAALAKRMQRIAARVVATRGVMLTVLDATGQKKVERPRATISRRDGSLSVQITDEASVPTQLCKTTVTPDKAAIKKQLTAGETVPGADLVRGPAGVTVRVA